MIIPYVRYLGIAPSSISIQRVLLVTGVQSALFFGLVLYLGFKALVKTDLQPFFSLRKKTLFQQILVPAVIFGGFVGLTISLLDSTIFYSSSLSGMHTPFWIGALASFYGAINEEVLLRFFLFTSIYFLVGKFLKISKNNRVMILWSVNIFVALLFGAGHLYQLSKISCSLTSSKRLKINDRKWRCIAFILRHLRSLIFSSFQDGQTPTYF